MIDQLLADAIDKKISLLLNYMLNERDAINVEALALIRIHLTQRRGLGLNSKSIRDDLKKGHLNVKNVFLASKQSRSVLPVAAQNGFIKFMKWALKQGYILTNSVLYWAIKPKNDKMIKFLLDKKCPFPPTGYEAAARMKARNAIRLFYEAGYPLTLDLFKEAARNLGPDNLEWLKARNCPWDYTVYEAASPENKKWLAKNGCSVSKIEIKSQPSISKPVADSETNSKADKWAKVDAVVSSEIKTGIKSEADIDRLSPAAHKKIWNILRYKPPKYDPDGPLFTENSARVLKYLPETMGIWMSMPKSDNMNEAYDKYIKDGYYSICERGFGVLKKYRKTKTIRLLDELINITMEFRNMDKYRIEMNMPTSGINRAKDVFNDSRAVLEDVMRTELKKMYPDYKPLSDLWIN